MLEGSAAIQEDHHKLEKWAMRKLLKFNKGKCKSCTWAKLTPLSRTGWSQLAWWWLAGKGAGSPGLQHVEHVSSVHCGNKGPSAYWAFLGRVKPAVKGSDYSPSLDTHETLY